MLIAPQSPFTDIHSSHYAGESPSDAELTADRTARLACARLSLVTMLRTWSGVFFLCGPDHKQSGLAALLSILRLQNDDV